MKLGFIGLGSMGRAMAQNLLSAGHELVVYNRTRARAEPLREQGARVAESPAEAAQGNQAVISILADDRAVEEVVFGDGGLIHGLAPGAVHVSSSTLSVDLSKRLAGAHAAQGQGYVAAPVFGRPEAAVAKQLWVVAAGRAADVESCRPIFAAIGRGLSRVGEEAPAANVVKLAGNFIIASMIESLSEAFTLARKSGVEADLFREVFSSVMGPSPIFDRYAGLIADRAKPLAVEASTPVGFKMYLGLKDVRLALAAGDAAEVPMPLASLLRDQLLSAVAQGHGDLDWSALAALAAERAGLGGSGR
jgi:3-hydroxyisobutyrate dehydrogenase-like beta-hydroxyacid dehydrogenase